MKEGQRPQFDRYATSYRALHAESIRISGEAPDYFARYKIDELARTSTSVRRSGAPAVLDFGCGIGGSIPWFRSRLPAARLTGVDVSGESLALARAAFPGDVRFEAFDGSHLPFADDSFDIVFASCVFHHIPPEERPGALAEIRRVLRPGGEIFLFEHNPWNPLTRRVVCDCPFDEDAVLLTAPEALQLVRDAGFSASRRTFTVFFPRMLAALRPLERLLAGVPLGGQYYIHAHA